MGHKPTYTNYRPAAHIFVKYGIPRSMLRQLAEDGVIKCEERYSADGVNMMRLFCLEDVETYLNNSGG
jgi:hypothetical protein